jgi:oxalate decarboxylase/phosphoglucose isomerase-like protein (cupin superfamily)
VAYVEPSTAGNRSIDTLDDIRQRNGPGTWRVPVAASEHNRVLLYQWAPGTSSDAHIHPGADELFVLQEGQATFTLGDGHLVHATAGSIVYVPSGQLHTLTATGERPLLMLIVVSPNAPDDTIASGA